MGKHSGKNDDNGDDLQAKADSFDRQHDYSVQRSEQKDNSAVGQLKKIWKKK